MTNKFKPKRALISVSDKRGLFELAKTLVKHQIEMVATGNTANFLKSNQFTVKEVAECTRFPEMLDGRVKTLHPAIHAGLLARDEQDNEVLETHQIKRFDLLIVNLYPFEQVISRQDCDFHKAIENIDIGGPAMVRSAAKNHAHVFVIVTPDDYDKLGQFLAKGQVPADWGFELAKKAFAHTAAYDAAIANFLGTLNHEKKPSGFPSILTQQFNKQSDLRYGENPHQQAAFYVDKNPAVGSLASAEVLQGKELSYNNLLDADAALTCVKEFDKEKSACVIIKHGNPCGIALKANQEEAYRRAYQSDPQSSYGGIIAFNQILEEATVNAILESQFVEVIVAPAIAQGAKKQLSTKPNVRVLITGDWASGEEFKLDMRRVDGGLLLQEYDNFPMMINQFKQVTERKPTQQQMQDLIFAWSAVRHVKSNAIVFVKDLATIGIGAGQSSRVMSTRVGLWQAENAGFSTKDSVMASDAFIPFPDSLEAVAGAGITAVIQPGGSVRDKEIIAKANALGIAMLMTGYRHFRH